MILSNRTSIYKLTQDDWHGNYFVEMSGNHCLGEAVEVIFNGNITTNEAPIWRVSIWGTDDFGMEKDFYCQKAASNCFVEVISHDYIGRDMLIKMGFVTA